MLLSNNILRHRLADMRVGVYVRLSEETDGLGLQRQEADARALAKRRKWNVIELYSDPDNSAYKRKPRPAFEAMLRDLESGKLEGILVYDLDRLARRPADLERLLDLYEARPFGFATCGGELDLATSDGRFVARLMINIANKSSADAGRRITRKHIELAQNGVPVGGFRPFGWQADRRTIEPAEAEMIRDAVDALLAGASLRSIMYSWNAAGSRTTAGNEWARGPLKNTLTSPRLVGWRTYRREIARTEDGEPVIGQWEPILDVDTWQRLVAKLESPAGTRVGARRYLLSGIIRCGLCGARLTGNRDSKKGTAYYACRRGDDGGCGRVGISAPKTDEHITALVLERLADVREAEPAPVIEGEDELAGKARRLADLMSAFTAGRLTLESVLPSLNKLESEIAVLRRSRAKAATVCTDRSVTPDAWPHLELSLQREIVAETLTVLVLPATQRGGRFAADRLRVELRS